MVYNIFCSQVDTNLAPIAWTNWLKQRLNLILNQIQKVFGDKIGNADNILHVKTDKLNSDNYREQGCTLRAGVNHKYISDISIGKPFQLQDINKLFLKETRNWSKNDLWPLRKIDSSTPRNVLEKPINGIWLPITSL